MSTLEKLLVLGVLVLVGVILSISLFWNRPDFKDAKNSEGSGLVIQHGQADNPNLPAPPTLNPSDANANNDHKIANNAQPAGGQVNPAVADSGKNQNNSNGVLIAGNASTSRPADGKPPILSRAVPSAFVKPGPTPSFFVYKVQKDDTPRSISKKLTGSDKFAVAIDRASEGQPMVPGRDILIPAEIFNNVTPPSAEPAKNPATGELVDQSTPVKTGPNTSKASTPADRRAGNGDASRSDAAAKPDAGAGDAVTYTVKRGDSLRRIARVILKSESRWKEIRDMNQLKGDAIREGQKLNLPAK
jgi:LysM repeat protein